MKLVNIEDLKSSGQKCPYEFDSRPSYESYKTTQTIDIFIRYFNSSSL